MCPVRTRNNGNRFIEQYEWTIGVCITVQIGERGKITDDVQIGECGKQRVKASLKTVLGQWQLPCWKKSKFKLYHAINKVRQSCTFNRGILVLGW